MLGKLGNDQENDAGQPHPFPWSEAEYPKGIGEGCPKGGKG
jgi:hypothetical protein